MNNKTACPQGHEYSESNTYHYRGSRYCRICLSEKLVIRRKKKNYKKRLIDQFGDDLGTRLFEEMKGKI